jgi:hypothetical protein
LRDRRIKASLETVQKSLVGDYRAEHIFTLKQSTTAYRYYQQLIVDCDQEIQQRIQGFQSKHSTPTAPAESAPPSTMTESFNLRSHLERIFGVDLTAIPGFDCLRVQAIFSELGAQICRSFKPPMHLLPGSISVPKTAPAPDAASALQKSNLEIASPNSFDLPLKPFPTASPIWATICVLNGPDMARRRRSKIQLTKSLAFSIS